MHKLLEQFVVHYLNNDEARATDLLHEFMLMRARQVHEAWRKDEDFDMTQFESEEYFTEDDLSDLEDTDDLSGEGESDGASDELAGDLGADGALGGEDDLGGEGDLGADGADDLGTDDGSGEGTEERLDDVEDQLAALSAEFERIMATIDADGDGEHTMDDHASEGEAGAEDEGSEDENTDVDGEGSEDENADDQDQVKESTTVVMDDEDDFDDITESVIADLEKVLVTMTDGKEIGKSGSTVSQNKTSPLPQKGFDARQGGKAVETKFTAHTGHEREPAPASKTVPATKNVRKHTLDGVKTVPAPKNKDEAGNTKSVISGK